MCTQWVAKDRSVLHADSEDSDQTWRMPRLICVFDGRTCHFVGFVVRWPYCVMQITSNYFEHLLVSLTTESIPIVFFFFFFCFFFVIYLLV